MTKAYNIFNQSLVQSTLTKNTLAQHDNNDTSTVEFAEYGSNDSDSIKSLISTILQNNTDICHAFFNLNKPASLLRLVINDEYFTNQSSANSRAIDEAISLATTQNDLNIICDIQLCSDFVSTLQQSTAGTIEASQRQKLAYLCKAANTIICDQQTFTLITAIELKYAMQLQQTAQTKQQLDILFKYKTPAFIVRPNLTAHCLYYYIEGDKQATFALPVKHNNTLKPINNLLCSTFCSFQLLGKRTCDALVLAFAYLQQNLTALLTQQNNKKLDGAWPHDINNYPAITTTLNQKTVQPFATTNTLSLGLYPVVDSTQWLEKLLALGVKTIQLRIKDTAPDQLEQEIATAAALGKKYQARLFINDYWKLAIKHQCYGVHLGQEDLDDTDLAAIQSAGLKLGISTHSEYEWLRAIAIKPSYIAMGTVYPTQTKPAILIGLDNLHHWSRVLSKHYPLVAIGGIKLGNIDSVLASGVGSIAVVTAITLAKDYQQAVAQLSEKQQKQF